MRQTEAELLRAQLQEMLDSDDDAEPIEVAGVAGLLSRLSPDDPLLQRVRAAVPDAPGLGDAAHEALEWVEDIDEDDEAEVSWDALCALDEVCAGATFLERTVEVRPAASEAARTIRAFPEPWGPHSERASEVLRDRRPRPGDPALAIWAGVESARWPRVHASEGASPEARMALGLDVVVPLFFPQPARLAAAALLPPERPWLTLARGETWELALTTDAAHQTVVLLSGPRAATDAATATVDGSPVAGGADPVGLRFTARAGTWVVVVEGVAHHFELRP